MKVSLLDTKVENFWSGILTTCQLLSMIQLTNVKSLNRPKPTPQNRQLLINSKRQKSTQKVEKFPKITKFRKLLNHVFKTSKKTLSYSRTYCKIYKIENIGKIGQSRAGIMAKRVIYYGSTRSTLSTPLTQDDPLIFIDESQNPEKSEIITFEAFWAKNAKIVIFDTFDQFLTSFTHVSLARRHLCHIVISLISDKY